MVPKIYEQACVTYAAMLERSEPAKEPGSPPVYRGYITYLVEELGFGISHYTVIMRRLVAMGCINQLVAGGRAVPSEWEMLHEPTPALFAANSGRKHSRIDDLEKRVAQLEEEME